MAEEAPRKVRRVRRVIAAPKQEAPEEPPARPPADKEEERKPSWRVREPSEEPPEGEDYRFVRVPDESSRGGDAGLAAIKQQVKELYDDFVEAVPLADDSFRQFMLWAHETEGVKFQDLLIAMRSIFDIMERPLPGDKRMWDEFRDMANLVNITAVSDSELEYALEVFSKTFDLYKDELRRLETERAKAEDLSTRRISDEILAEDEGLLGGGKDTVPGKGGEGTAPAAKAEAGGAQQGVGRATGGDSWEEATPPSAMAAGAVSVARPVQVVPPAPQPVPAAPQVARAPGPGAELGGEETAPAVEADRWDKMVDDTRSKINSTKAEFDELVEELTPFKAERDASTSRLRVLDKDGNRKRARLEWFQRGRISEAKADEIGILERDLGMLEAEASEWTARLGSAQRHIDGRLDAIRRKRGEFDSIRDEVEGVVAGLGAAERSAVLAALEGELQDLQSIVRDAVRWLGELQVETSTVPLAPARPAAPAAVRPRSPDAVAPRAEASPAVAAPPAGAAAPPVVYRDEEVREMLSKVIERPPEEELGARIEQLQKELVNRENRILELEGAIERLIEEKQGSPTAVDLERNKMRLELARTQEELGGKQRLLEQYIEVIRSLEDQMAKKDRELKETLELNKRKTDELRAKEEALKRIEHELLERQEEHRAERQELQDREARLNAQVADREAHEREIAKKELTLELRSEQVRKKMDRLTVREIELQRLMSQHKEIEEQLALKERELQNLRAELDVREEEQRRREAAVEERSGEAKKYQSELGKLEHRLRTQQEQLKRREGKAIEDEQRIARLESAAAERELQLHGREEALGLRESEVTASGESNESARAQLEAARKQAGEERLEVDRVRLLLEKRQEELLRHEDQLGTRETTLRERERACQIREERLQLERKDLEVFRSQADELERRWAQRERSLLDQMAAFNAEKEELLSDWKSTKKRLHELEKEKADLSARVLAAEAAVWEKDELVANMMRQIENARAGAGHEQYIELDDGTKVTIRKVLQDMQRQRGLLGDVDERASAVEARERELEAMEEMLAKEKADLQELASKQQGGLQEARRSMEELESRARALDSREARVKQAEAGMSRADAELLERERAVRERESAVERVSTAQGAEERAVEREEELSRLLSGIEERTRALEGREEALETRSEELARREAELARARRELEAARENLLRARGALGEVPAPVVASPPSAPRLAAEPRRRPGLAKRAAEMAAGAQGAPPARPPAPAAPSTATVVEATRRAPLARVRCRVCGTVIPIYTRERPIQVICPSCGKAGEVR